MLFNSINFILFFVGVVLLYYIIPCNRMRKIVLLFASYYFYACFNVAMLTILLFETLIAYIYGRNEELINKEFKKKILIGVIILLLLPLICFKYLNFISDSIADALSIANVTIQMPKFELLLPVGISFYTFMAVGYVFDIYKKKIRRECNILDFALFIGFFPQIASGPIGRAGQLIPQFKKKKTLQYQNVTAGVKMMLWGFFMKLVIGDRAGIYVDTVFNNYIYHNGASLLLATFLYTVQIYCDFAGYSIIAIGAAKTMGFELLENFRRPYYAVSVGDFWRKWHISLSSWFRDYVYFPIGGSKCSRIKTYRNIMITFLVSGLWHGASYNFIIWGGYHGACQIVGRIIMPYKERIRRLLHIKDDCMIRKTFDIISTICLISYGWMIFYAPNMHFICSVTKKYFQMGKPYIHQTTIFFFAIGFLLLFFKDLKDEFFLNKIYLLKKHHPIATKIWHYIEFSTLAVLIVWIGVLGGGQFIYFKF